MVDPVGVTSLAIQVTTGLYRYIKRLHAFEEDSQAALAKIRVIHEDLRILKACLRFKLPRPALRTVQSRMADLERNVQKLQDEQKRLFGQPNEASASKMHLFWQKVAYPVRHVGLKAIYSNLEELQKNLDFALRVLKQYANPITK